PLRRRLRPAARRLRDAAARRGPRGPDAVRPRRGGRGRVAALWAPPRRRPAGAPLPLRNVGADPRVTSHSHGTARVSDTAGPDGVRFPPSGAAFSLQGLSPARLGPTLRRF